MSQVPKERGKGTRSSLPAAKREDDAAWPRGDRDDYGPSVDARAQTGSRTGPTVMVTAVVVWLLAVTVGIVAWAHRGQDEPEVALPPEASSPAAAPTSEPEPTPSASESSPGRSERPSRSDQPDQKKDERPDIPAAGSGTYERQEQSAKPSSKKGLQITYDVRVENGLPYDASEIAETIHSILDDERSWSGTGEWRFRLVGPGEKADLHAYLATPKTTDKLCAPLLTGGEVSCRNGEKVVLNAKRWAFGAEAYGKDIVDYRRYLVNHEFGHALGFGHVDCPGKGRPAPIMMQQTKGLDKCTKNPWPAGDD